MLDPNEGMCKCGGSCFCSIFPREDLDRADHGAARDVEGVGDVLKNLSIDFSSAVRFSDDPAIDGEGRWPHFCHILINNDVVEHEEVHASLFDSELWSCFGSWPIPGVGHDATSTV